MEEKTVCIDDIEVNSLILSEKQRKWLDGEKDALSYRERSIWSNIRKRLSNALTEFSFIRERMPPEQMQKIGRQNTSAMSSSNIGLPHQPINQQMARNIRKTSEAGAAALGAGGAVGLIEEGIEESMNEQNPNVPEIIASIVESVFEEKGYDRSEYVDVWDSYAEEIRRELNE